MNYNKLSNLVDQEITINNVGKWTYKKWDAVNSKMLTSEKYQEDFRKVYTVDTDQGIIDISSSQMGQMLEGVSIDGASDINRKTFKVKSNGKTGKEIRYFINPVFNSDTVKVEHTTTEQAQPSKEIEDDLPF